MANEVAKKETRVTMAEYVDKTISNVLEELGKKKNTGLMLPHDYAPMNALTSAMFILARTVDKQNRPVLESCTPTSVREALMDMLLSALTPAKKQCYFIAYGDKLTYMDSYFGVQTKAKRADPNIDIINATVVYKKDEFSYTIEDATITNIVHKQDPDNIDITQIRGAYATIVYRDGTRKSDYMTMKQIETSWARGATKGGSDAHKMSPQEMCKRTVLKRHVKAIVNSSTDADLFYDNEDFSDVDNEYNADEATMIIGIPTEHEGVAVDADGVIEDEAAEENMEAEPVSKPAVKQAQATTNKEQQDLFNLG